VTCVHSYCTVSWKAIFVAAKHFKIKKIAVRAGSKSSSSSWWKSTCLGYVVHYDTRMGQYMTRQDTSTTKRTIPVRTDLLPTLVPHTNHLLSSYLVSNTHLLYNLSLWKLVMYMLAPTSLLHCIQTLLLGTHFVNHIKIHILSTVSKWWMDSKKQFQKVLLWVSEVEIVHNDL